MVLRWLVHSLGTSGLICALLPIQIIYTILCAQQSTHTITQTKKKDRHFWEYSGEVCSDLRSAGKPVALNTSVTSIAVCLFVCLFVAPSALFLGVLFRAFDIKMHLISGRSAECKLQTEQADIGALWGLGGSCGSSPAIAMELPIYNLRSYIGHIILPSPSH